MVLSNEVAVSEWGLATFTQIKLDGSIYVYKNALVTYLCTVQYVVILKWFFFKKKGL